MFLVISFVVFNEIFKWVVSLGSRKSGGDEKEQEYLSLLGLGTRREAVKEISP